MFLVRETAALYLLISALFIFEQGMLCKRGYQVKHWKDRWFVLRKNCLKYYTNMQEKELKGCINIVKDCRIEVRLGDPAQRTHGAGAGGGEGGLMVLTNIVIILDQFNNNLYEIGRSFILFSYFIFSSDKLTC